MLSAEKAPLQDAQRLHRPSRSAALSDETVGYTYAEQWLDQPVSHELSLLINVK